MQKQISSLLLIISFVLSVSAQNLPESNLRKHVEYLASEKLEGRRTGERGAMLASEYIADQFRKIKLKTPGGTSKGSFYQPFLYVTGVEAAAAGNEFRLRFVDSGPPTPADIRPAGFSPNAEVANAPIVFAGFGIISPEQNRDDYSGVDAKGKIVIIFDGNPEIDNPHSTLGRFDARTKALIARDKGAVGLLIITREQNIENDKLARMSFDQTLGESALPTMVVPRSAAATILGVSDVELGSFELGKIRRGNAKTLASAEFKIKLNKKVSEARNVIGILPGTDPILKSETIVIGAHYDHLGRGGQGSLDVNSSEIHYGADDNASGTAAILELARQFAAERNKKRTIIFIAFSGEEEGLLGSKYYVNNPVWPLDKTVAMINLDMVGRLNNEKLTIGGIGTASEWRILTLETAVNWPTQGAFRPASPTPVVLSPDSNTTFSVVPPTAIKEKGFDLQLNDDGFGPSDHSSFYGKKIPVLFFFTGTHVDYHKSSDTADKINYDGLGRITRFVAALTKSIDVNPQKPTYAVAKSSGMAGGRTGFNISLGTIPSYADSTDGLVLDGVRENSPAAKAGVKVGDKIVRLAGKDVRNAMDYTYVLGEMKAGEEYEIVVLRGTERLTLKIIPAARK